MAGMLECRQIVEHEMNGKYYKHAYIVEHYIIGPLKSNETMSNLNYVYVKSQAGYA